MTVNIIRPIKSAERLLNKCYLRFGIIAFIRDPQFCSFIRRANEVKLSQALESGFYSNRDVGHTDSSQLRFPRAPLKDIAFSNIYRYILLVYRQNFFGS